MSRNEKHKKLRANHARPALLLDIDGVFSLFGFDGSERPPGRFLVVDGIPHYLSESAGPALRALAESFEAVWCSGWEETANDYLPHALGLPAPLPFLTFDGARRAEDTHWKLAAIEAFAGPRRPLAWVDDDHRGCEQWARSRAAPTLLVTTRPEVGLTPAHVERLLAWAAELAAAAP